MRSNFAIRFAARLVTSRWFVVVAAIWIQSCSGSTYNFGFYAQSMKTRLGYDQQMIDTISGFKDLGANVGIVSGLIFDWSSPWGVLAIGAVESAFAYLMMWFSQVGKLPSPQFWQTCVYMFLAANGQTFFNTGCVVTCVQNFPQSRGLVIGLIKGFLGLSGGIMMQLYYGIYGDEPTSYLLLAAWLPTLVTCLLMFLVRLVPAALEERNESENLYILSAIAVSLAAFLMGIIILEHTIVFRQAVNVIVCVVVCGVLLLPLGVVFKSVIQETGGREQLLLDNGMEVSQSGLIFLDRTTTVHVRLLGRCYHDCCLPSILASKAGSSSGAGRGKRLDSSNGESFPHLTEFVDLQHSQLRKPRRGDNHSVSEALRKTDFWLLCLAMACGMGSALTAIDNTARIGASLGYSAGDVETFVSLFSIWNFMGRLGFGALSEVCLQRYKVGRTVTLAFSQGLLCMGYLLMCVGHFMFGSTLPGSLYPSIVIISLCFGAQWSLMPAITSELFGLRRFASLFNIISMASPVGASFLSVQVARRVYEAQAKIQQDNWNSIILRPTSITYLECHGPQCFQLTFIILTAVSLFGCLVCVRLATQTKNFYSQMF